MMRVSPTYIPVPSRSRTEIACSNYSHPRLRELAQSIRKRVSAQPVTKSRNQPSAATAAKMSTALMTRLRIIRICVAGDGAPRT